MSAKTVYVQCTHLYRTRILTNIHVILKRSVQEPPPHHTASQYIYRGQVMAPAQLCFFLSSYSGFLHQ